LQIASGDYTATQHDAGAAEGNQQLAKQLWHTRENNTKINILESPTQISQKLPHQECHRLNILAVTCLASRSSFPMHRYKLHVPKIINLQSPLRPHSGGFNLLNP
jgi:hypothetical protein